MFYWWISVLLTEKRYPFNKLFKSLEVKRKGTSLQHDDKNQNESNAATFFSVKTLRKKFKFGTTKGSDFSPRQKKTQEPRMLQFSSMAAIPVVSCASSGKIAFYPSVSYSPLASKIPSRRFSKPFYFELLDKSSKKIRLDGWNAERRRGTSKPLLDILTDILTDWVSEYLAGKLILLLLACWSSPHGFSLSLVQTDSEKKVPWVQIQVVIPWTLGNETKPRIDEPLYLLSRSLPHPLKDIEFWVHYGITFIWK